METKKKHHRSSSGSSRDSDRSRDDSRRRRDGREDTRRKDDRTGRRKERDRSRDASRTRGKGSSKFEDRFADIQRQSRINYSSDEGSPGPKSKQKQESRSPNRGERRDSPKRAESRNDTKSRGGKSQSRSRDRLDDRDSERDERRGRSREGRRQRDEERSYPSDDDQRNRNGTKKSKHSKEVASRESNATRYDSDASYRGTSRPKSKNENVARLNRHEDGSEEVELTPSSRKKEDREKGELNRGFENSEVRSQQTRYDSDASHQGRLTSRNRLDAPSNYDSDARKADRRTERQGSSGISARNEDNFQDVELSSPPERDEKPTDGTINRATKNSEVQLRPVEGRRIPQDQTKRNGIVQSNEPPDSLTFRARELNNVLDPRSTLCQRTDIMLGVMDTRRDLTETDAFALESPKGRKITTYIAAAISVVEALLGLAVGIFLLVNADKQNIADYKTYMVYTYMILHGLALIFGLLLIWANKECQLDLMIAWIAVQISTGIVFIAGTILFLVVEMLPKDADFKELVIGAPFIYFSSAFLLFNIVKVLTVTVVILRYQRLTYRPPTRAPTPAPPSRWTEYQPSPDESRAPPSTGSPPEHKEPEGESGAHMASGPSEVPTMNRQTPSKVPPPPPARTVSIVDETVSKLQSERTPLAETAPSLSRTGRHGSERSQSSVSTAISEPQKITIPRATTLPDHGASLKPPLREGRTPSPKPDSSSVRPKPSHGNEELYDQGSRHRLSERDVPSSRQDYYRREPQYPSREPSHLRPEPRDWRQEVPHAGSNRYYREAEDQYSARDPPITRDRSPHSRPTASYARPIPAERPSLANRTRPVNPYQNDPEPTHGNPGRRYLPYGAVPAIGSPEEWERNHYQFAYGMPQPRNDGALQGAVRRRQNDLEPEPDY